MFEVVTEAIVLDKEDVREQDQRVYLYTKDFGKVIAKTVSTRKILSKLASHLEPMNLVTARLVSKGDGAEARGMMLVDALSSDNAATLKKDPQKLSQAIQVCALVHQSIPVGVPDEDLWNFLHHLRSGNQAMTFDSALHALGFKAQFARCQTCDRTQPEYFVPGDNFFICTGCTFNARNSDVSFIKIAAYGNGSGQSWAV